MGLDTPRCPSCSAPFPESSVDGALSLARCGYCGTVLDLSRIVAAETGKPIRRRPRVALPEGIEVFDTSARGLGVRWRWFRARHLLLTLFTALVLFGISYTLQSPKRPDFSHLVLYAFVCVALVYGSLAHLINRTTLLLATGSLETRHGPLPWPGGRRWTAASIDQLYVKSRTFRTKLGTYKEIYDLWVRCRDGTRNEILRGVDDLEPLLWLEQEIEARLGLIDAPEHGEIMG